MVFTKLTSKIALTAAGLTVAAVTQLVGAGAVHASPEGAARPAAVQQPAAVHPNATMPIVTVGTNVNERSCASASCSVLYTIPRQGTAVYPQCYKSGSSVNGDSIWYYAPTPLPDGGEVYGYVAGYWLSTGHDPDTADFPRVCS